MMSDFENKDVILGNDNINTFERDFSNVIGNSEGHCDNESNSRPREKDFHENGSEHYVRENIIPGQDRFQETMETFNSEFNMRLSQEMDSIMSMMHIQLKRAISTAIADRVIPEIQNIVSSRSSSGNRDTEAGSSLNSQENTERHNGFKTKTTKKVSRSACDLRVTRDSRPYTFAVGPENYPPRVSLNISFILALSNKKT